MGYRVTSFRRQLVMGVLLTLAVSGGVIRHYADDPSTMRDLGTLLLVLWLPAVGNFVGFVVRKLPRAPPPPTEFAAGSRFRPQLHASFERLGADAGAATEVDAVERRCTLLVGRHGYTVRLEQPLAQALAVDGPQTLAMELLLPAAARGKLVPGTGFHVLTNATAVARGSVLQTTALDA